MKLKATDILSAINRLPATHKYPGDFYKALIQRAVPSGRFIGGDQYFFIEDSFIEFEKSEDGRDWLLASMPDY